MCVTETYSRIGIGKNLCDIFPIRNGFKVDVLSPMHSNSALEYKIRRLQVT
jgi:hypothetical protein